MTSSLRIGIVGPLPPPSGGMATQTKQLFSLLNRHGSEMSLIQCNRPYRPAWVGRLRIIRAVFRLIPYLAELWKEAGRVDIFHVMANSGWSWHLYAAPAIWIGWFRGTKVIVNYRGGDAEKFFEHTFPIVKRSLKRADAIVVPSKFLEAVFGKFGMETRIVPNIIDIEKFSAENLRRKNDSDGMYRLLVTRNLETIYDIATAIRAFAYVHQVYPNSVLMVAGTGDQQQTLKKLTEELGIERNVVFTGRVDNDKIAELYATADVLVNPSLVDNMPISILEALASGVPVVSTDVGGIPYLVKDRETALLVPARDPKTMAQAILSVFEDRGLANRLRDRGRKEVSKYDWQNVLTQWSSLYEEILRI